MELSSFLSTPCIVSLLQSCHREEDDDDNDDDDEVEVKSFEVSEQALAFKIWSWVFPFTLFSF